jgi:hypothetical protein
MVAGAEHMKERTLELAIQSGLPTALDYHQKRYEKFADLIRADERKELEAELLKLKNGIGANSDYIQGRWDLIGEFQDVIRARGNT